MPVILGAQTVRHDQKYFHSIPEAIEAIKNGEVIIVVDDENRENKVTL